MLVLSIAASACTSTAQQIDSIASDYGFTRSIVKGKAFEHVIYFNGRHDPAAPLHVYLEGDGTPYLNLRTVAPDPTPHQPLMLRLMALDPGPAIYLGRPCYLGLARRAPCSPDDWTIDRFSSRVVESLASALAISAGHTQGDRLELFGHSGGGTLAVLLGRRIGGVERVITLAGNLDHRAWSEMRGFSPLDGSLNPVDEGPLPRNIVQLHLVGELDRNIPPAIVKRAALRLGNGKVRVLPSVRHACCWEESWRAVLADH